MYALAVLFTVLIMSVSAIAALSQTAGSAGHIWKQIIAQADGLGLPTKFLAAVPADFVRFEFDDLQAFAAEYHPSEHRMVLNRTLSFNVAGGTLRPLSRLTHAELETLYHELFHAYMDYLASHEAQGQPHPLLSFARNQQRCRYGVVMITPVVQRKQETEERFLTDGEAWEALNEGWAVFVGWTVWNRLEMRHPGDRSVQSGKHRDAWLRRFEEADREGKLRGYYEPEDPAERSVTRKRFLAANSRLSSEEIGRLMTGPLEFSADLVRQVLKRLEKTQGSLLHAKGCGGVSSTH